MMPANITTTSCIKILEGLKVDPDFSSEQRLSLQQSIFLALSSLVRRDSDQKEMLKDDAKSMHLIVNGLEASIKHGDDFPQHAWLIMARIGESTDFSANAAFNKVASKIGPSQMTRHKLVSDLQLAITTSLYNSEAIRFEKEPAPAPVAAAPKAAGGFGKSLGGLGGLKKKPGL